MVRRIYKLGKLLATDRHSCLINDQQTNQMDPVTDQFIEFLAIHSNVWSVIWVKTG